jgi:hypothetical protein
MKKIIIMAAMLIAVVSCKKEEGYQCYHCTFGITNGVHHKDVDYCGTDGGMRQFNDEQGNPLNVHCEQKH